ncbi:uncharacterized protein LOC135396511 [Ornithodoros turicata]|uniref:uncharacterized protein LOC135396511 n=1 Tax=Ornithodoros turicata TaxID=34597 RepID=UPI0031393DFF
MLVSANIPIEKTDHPKVRTFLQKRVTNGGSVPLAKNLRNRLPELFAKHQSALKGMFSGATVSVVIDETTDNRAKSVVNALFVKASSTGDSLQPVLVDVTFTNEVNAAVIGRIVVKALMTYGVEFEDVTALVTDSASYMKKAFRECIQPLCSNAVHVTCVAHGVNLIGATMYKSFPLVDKYVGDMKKAFRLSSGKRALFKAHLQECGVENPRAPPAPVKTRWNSWIEAVELHSEYFEHYPSLLEKVQERYGDAAGVDSLVSMMQEIYTELKYTTRCIAIFGKKVASLLKAAEGQEVAAHKVYNALFALWGYLKAASLEDYGTLMRQEGVQDDEAAYVGEQIRSGMCQAARKAQELLEKSETWKFFKSMRALDPLQLKSMSHELCDYENIPGIGRDAGNLAAEWLLYINTAKDCKSSDRDLAPSVSKQVDPPPQPFDIIGFWDGMKTLTPALASIAVKYLCVPINSVDAGRSFSRYKMIVSDKRHSLSDENTKYHLMLSHNSFLML